MKSALGKMIDYYLDNKELVEGMKERISLLD